MHPFSVILMQSIATLGFPNALTTAMLDGPDKWWLDRRNRKSIGYRMVDCGYSRIKNPDNKQGVWLIAGRASTVYAKVSIEYRQRLKAANHLREEAAETLALIDSSSLA